MSHGEVVILILSSACSGGVLALAGGVIWLYRNRPRL